MRLRPTAAAKLLVIVGICSVPLLLHWALAQSAGRADLGLVAGGLVTLAAMPHTLGYLSFLAVFAASLMPGREPICSALARKLHGPLSSGMAHYARRVTQLWCAFFAAQLAVSLALFLTAPLSVWSFFVNVLNLPLAAALYALEYIWRRQHWADEAPPHSRADLARLVGLVRTSLSKPAS